MEVTANDLRKGHKLWLLNKGSYRLVTINRIWHGRYSTLVDYTNGTSDTFCSDKNMTNAYIAGQHSARNHTQEV
jgi:hypothetical protein